MGVLDACVLTRWLNLAVIALGMEWPLAHSRGLRLHRNPQRLVVPRGGRGARSRRGRGRWRTVCSAFSYFPWRDLLFSIRYLVPRATLL